MGLFGFVELVDGGLEVFGVGEDFGAVEEAVKGVLVEVEGFFAVFGGLFAVGLWVQRVSVHGQKRTRGMLKGNSPRSSPGMPSPPTS